MTSNPECASCSCVCAFSAHVRVQTLRKLSRRIVGRNGDAEDWTGWEGHAPSSSPSVHPKRLARQLGLFI